MGGYGRANPGGVAAGGGEETAGEALAGVMPATEDRGYDSAHAPRTPPAMGIRTRHAGVGAWSRTATMEE